MQPHLARHAAETHRIRGWLVDAGNGERPRAGALGIRRELHDIADGEVLLFRKLARHQNRGGRGRLRVKRVCVSDENEKETENERTPERHERSERLSFSIRVHSVSVTGITGERSQLPPELDAQIRTLRLVTTKPVCVGFGVSTPEQVAFVGRLADGVLVGSAIVRLVERHTGDPQLVDAVAKFIESLKAPLRVK